MAGEFTQDAVFERGSQTLGRSWRWLRPLARRFVDEFGDVPHPRRREAIRFLRNDAAFQSAWSRYRRQIGIEQWLVDPPRMEPVEAARDWALPAIETPGDLAHWLGLTPGELEWFADLHGLTEKHRVARLRHYRYRLVPKSSGGMRLVEIPKTRLKILQTQILKGILDFVPPHPAAHGFVRGRSIRTFAAPHANQRVVLRMDLRHFFASVTRARIQGVFRTMGFPEAVADLLGGICTNRVPQDVAKGADDIFLYTQPHLPQGAPASPSLANICSHRLDCRLARFAEVAQARYTRYADDLAFSGDEPFERCVERFLLHAAAIATEEGFSVHHRKTRVMRRGVRQHLAGIVVNEHPNVFRADFERLKATLTNCVRHGPESQNRDGHADFRAHLAGKLSFVEMIRPEKARRLRAIFGHIVWPGTES